MIAAAVVVGFVGVFDFEKGLWGWSQQKLKLSNCFVDYDEDLGLVNTENRE